jgi:hypothetical protein
MALQRTHRPRFLKVQSGAGVGVPVQEHAGTGRSLRSLGAPLNARSLGTSCHPPVAVILGAGSPLWRGTMRHRSRSRKVGA